MIRSMTGFGKGESKYHGGAVSVEIRSLNHRFFEPAFRLPDSLSVFEDRLREKVKRVVKRGKVSLFLNFKKGVCLPVGVSINEGLAKDYRDRVRKLTRELGLKDDIGMGHILSLPGVLIYEAPQEHLDRFWPNIEQALDKALDRLVKAREAEGTVLYDDIVKRVDVIFSALQKIEKRSPLVVEGYRSRLLRKLKGFVKDTALDKGRMEIEIALFARNCDITEETTRMEGHLKNFRRVLLKKGRVGQELDFVAQELNREVNTIGAKANDSRISKEVVRIKSEIGRIREQVHNVE